MNNFKWINLLIFACMLSAGSVFAGNEIINNNGVYYFAGKIVLKLTEQPFTSNKKVMLSSSLQKQFEKYGIKNAERKFYAADLQSKEGKELSRIISVEFSGPYDPAFLSGKLSRLKGIEWAEPHYLYETSYTPNDPSLSSQYALSKINAQLAWDTNKGDPSILIAIVDTGVDWDHPDLAENIWQNDDPVNGTDDDSNGYVDDIRGWDFGGLSGTPDNNPMEDRADHGTHVAGIASAVTDNGIGVASIGFNCTLMPVKTAQDNIRNQNGQALIAYGFEGIVYAADNSAKVINCSWGGSSFSIAGQEVIDYAVSKGALVVCAAGNDGVDRIIYPSGYEGALSVGSTTSSDQKSSFSNYGMMLDVLAPGSGIYGTWQNDTYATLSGTSMASPLTAGLAGLVANQFPSYSPLQIAEQIRATADNIESINPGLNNMLGRGRINARNALEQSNAKSVRAVNFMFIDRGDGDGVLEPGEQVDIEMNFVNYLSPFSGLTITAESSSGNVSFTNSSYSAGAVSTLGEFNNLTNKFSFTISPGVPANFTANILIKYSDAGYDDFQWISTTLNPTYSTQAGNNIALTITSKGALGFNDYPNSSQGDGFKYIDGPNLLFEGAFMYGISSAKLMDAARIDQAQSTDFVNVLPFVVESPGSVADQQGKTIFNDNGAGGNKLGVEITLNSYSFSAQEFENFILLKYTLQNKSTSDISNLFAGLFFDWDMIDGSGADDLTRYDVPGNFGYVYHQGGSPDTYVGVALVSSQDYGYYGIFNPGGSGSFNIYDGFTDAEKWLSISSGITNTTLPAGDISFVLPAGPFNIPSSSGLDVAFVIAAGNDLDSLRTAVQSGRTKYNSIITSVDNEDVKIPAVYSLEQNYPNPFNPATTIKYQLPSDGFVTLKIYDILGKEVAVLVNTKQSKGRYEVKFDASRLSSGVYIYRIRANDFAASRKMILLK